MLYLEHLPCPVLVTDYSGHILHINLAFKALIAPVPGDTMEQYFPPATRIFLQTHAWPLLLRQGSLNELYLQIRAADGHPVPVMTNACACEIDGEQIVIWLFFIARERTRFEAELLKARQQAQDTANQLAKVNLELEHAYARLEQYAQEVKSQAEHMAQLSQTDPLTGLANRRALDLSVRQWIADVGNQAVGSLLLIDLDFFKRINDRFGHAMGDRTLCDIARRLQESVYAKDTVVRYGGEEFAIWLPHAGREDAELTARRVHTKAALVQVAGQSITLSIGIASLAVQGQSAGIFLERLLNEADTALYEAKARGRNRTLCFDDLQ